MVKLTDESDLQNNGYYSLPSNSPRYNLVGVWEGQLMGLKGPGLYNDFVWDHRIRLRFSKEGTAVFLFENDSWEELDRGLWRTAQHETNAVVYAIDVSDDRPEDGFVETWSFTITRLNEDEMLVHWYRLVNNRIVSDDHPEAHYAFAANGVLKRISAP